MRLLNTKCQPGVDFYGYVINTWKTAGATVIYSLCFYTISLVLEVDSSQFFFSLFNSTLLWILQFQLNAYKAVFWNECMHMYFVVYKIIQWMHLQFV